MTTFPEPSSRYSVTPQDRAKWARTPVLTRTRIDSTTIEETLQGDNRTWILKQDGNPTTFRLVGTRLDLQNEYV